MSFDGAKVRRFFDTHKHFCVIVREHSLFIDTYQRKAEISIFLLFPIKRSCIWQKMRNFAG